MIAFAIGWFSSVDALGFWEWEEGVGIILICVGYVGKYQAQYRKFKNEPKDDVTIIVPIEPLKKQWEMSVKAWRHKWERIFWQVLLLGVVIELIGFGFAITISSKQIESLKNANLKLQVQLTELQTKEQVRIITEQERSDFIASLRDEPKGAVRMGVLGGFTEKTRIYAGEIQDLLSASGYKVNGIEVLDPAHFVPSLPPDTSIGVYTWSPQTMPPYADAISAALGRVADKVSDASLSDRKTWQVPGFKKNQVMVFIANHR